MSAEKKNEKWLNHTQLQARGWGVRAMRTLLPKPIFRAGVRVYSRREIIAIEKTAAWQNIRRNLKNYQEEMDGSPYIKYVNGLPLDIPEIEDLESEVLEFQGEFMRMCNAARGNVLKCTVEGASDESKARWCINYLKHNYTDYDKRTREWRHHPGATIKTAAYKYRILQQISEIYPQLREECQRQQRLLEKAGHGLG